MSKHAAAARPRSLRLIAAAGAGAVLALVLGVAGSATAASSVAVSSPVEAQAALDQAQQQLDAVRGYLKTLPTGSPSTPPTSTPSTPPSTQPPPAPGAVTAAERFGWGTPLPASDEFNTPGTPDPAKWSLYNGPGHASNGRRVAANNAVTAAGFLRQTGKANGDSAGMASKLNQRYGRWEARVRSNGTGSGFAYHPVLIVWPQSNRWPADGEYDFLENGAPGAACAEAFMHYPGHTPKVQEHAVEKNCGAPLSEWHAVAFEWTPQHVKGFIDGQEWFSFGAADMTAMPSGHLTIQLDNFRGSGMQPATFDVDWVRIYTL